MDENAGLTVRMLLGAYAPAAMGAGLVMMGWGPPLVKVLGAVVVMSGCFAVVLLGAQNKKAPIWFAVSQMVVVSVVAMERRALWGEAAPAWIVEAVLAGFAAFCFAVVTVDSELDGRIWTPLSLFGTKGRETVATRYERQMREAVAQEERHRLARELHDSIKQQIFVMQTAAATAEARLGGDESLTMLRQAGRDAMGEMEALLDSLRASPLTNPGLVEAIRKQGEALRYRTGAEVVCEFEALPASETMQPGAQQALHRAAQEALANVGRHARATRVKVWLGEAGGQLKLRVEDNGSGCDLEKAGRGMGLDNIRARAEECGGEFEIVSRPGAGTIVEVRIPVKRRDRDRWKRHRFAAIAYAFMVTVQAIRVSQASHTVMNTALLLVFAGMAVDAGLRWKRERPVR